MKHESLKQVLTKAKKGKYAIGHFNASTFEQMKAIAGAADKLKAPVMVGTSEGEIEYLGARRAVALFLQFDRESKAPMFLNLDHAKSFKICKQAIDAGYDSVHIDASKLSYAENVKLTRKVRDYAKLKNRRISVEGELGVIQTESSRVYKEKFKLDKKYLTDPGEAKDFVEKTRVDRLAPAIGTFHGMQTKGPNPHIHLERLKEIQKAIPDVFLVMHGGSGTPKGDIKKAVQAGLVVNIHISTEIRKVYAEELRKRLKDKDEYAPYRILEPVVSEMQKLVEQKIKEFKL